MIFSLILYYFCFYRTLIKRGADFNVEDLSGKRPDDVVNDRSCNDCADIILCEREQRIKDLFLLVKEVNLYYF